LKVPTRGEPSEVWADRGIREQVGGR